MRGIGSGQDPDDGDRGYELRPGDAATIYDLGYNHGHRVGKREGFWIGYADAVVHLYTHSGEARVPSADAGDAEGIDPETMAALLRISDRLAATSPPDQVARTDRMTLRPTPSATALGCPAHTQSPQRNESDRRGRG